MPREMKVHFNCAYQLCQYARTVRRRPACVLRSCVFHLDAQVGRLPRDPERVACSSILRLKICTGGSRTCHLFPFRLRLLILSFRGTLEALQGMFYAGSEYFRAKCFEKPTPPAWW